MVPSSISVSQGFGNPVPWLLHPTAAQEGCYAVRQSAVGQCGGKRWHETASPSPRAPHVCRKAAPAVLPMASSAPQRLDLGLSSRLGDSLSPPPSGLRAGSALFRHEIGYVLGQMQDEACVPQLTAALRSRAENPMVRHECAEALGSIARPSCLETLRAFARDPVPVCRRALQAAGLSPAGPAASFPRERFPCSPSPWIRGGGGTGFALWHNYSRLLHPNPG